MMMNIGLHLAADLSPASGGDSDDYDDDDNEPCGLFDGEPCQWI